MLQFAQKIGLKVPDELAIVGFGNLPLSTRLYPELTTVDVPRYELGRQAMIMFSKLKGTDSEHKKKSVCLPAKLIVRQST